MGSHTETACCQDLSPNSYGDATLGASKAEDDDTGAYDAGAEKSRNDDAGTTTLRLPVTDT